MSGFQLPSVTSPTVFFCFLSLAPTQAYGDTMEDMLFSEKMKKGGDAPDVSALAVP
jgi:hypothetical protein